MIADYSRSKSEEESSLQINLLRDLIIYENDKQEIVTCTKKL